MNELSLLFLKINIYFAPFFGEDFLLADLGFEAFFAAVGFFVAVDLGFFGVVAFFVLGFAAFLVAVFLTPAGLVVPVFFAFVCFGLVVFVPVADFGLALVFGFDVLAIRTFFGFAAVVVDDDEVVAAGVVVVDDVVAALFVFAAVATFFAGFDPADFERARFFVPDADVDDEEEVFFVFVDFFFVGFALSFNLNEPLAPFPLVCFNDFDLIPFFKANFKR